MDMDSDLRQMCRLLPEISTQLRNAMSNLHLAAAQLAPADRREEDPDLDLQAARLDQSYYRLLRLVNNLTALADLEQDTPPAERDQDIVKLVRSVYERAAFLGKQAGVQVKFSCDMAEHICGFSERDVEQILFQLLSNAIKFTPQGGLVTLEAACEHSRLLLTVSDTGCGISKDRMDTIFTQFLHPDPMAPYPHGMGMGLAICRRLAMRMGGNLLASPRESGSCMVLSLPDRRCGQVEVSDVRFDYTGGFNRTLLSLADALPAEAFRIRNQF